MKPVVVKRAPMRMENGLPTYSLGDGEYVSYWTPEEDEQPIIGHRLIGLVEGPRGVSMYVSPILLRDTER